jgi:hypothetical protein
MSSWAAPHRQARTELRVARLGIPGGGALALLSVAFAPALHSWFGPLGAATVVLTGVVGVVAFLFGLVALGLWVIDRR